MLIFTQQLRTLLLVAVAVGVVLCGAPGISRAAVPGRRGDHPRRPAQHLGDDPRPGAGEPRPGVRGGRRAGGSVVAGDHRRDWAESLALQVDRKARHADGSLRHAVLSVILPALPVSTRRRCCSSAATGRRPGPTLTVAALLVTGYDSRVDVTLDGRRYGASARSLLEAQPWRHLAGRPVATEWLGSAPLPDAAGRRAPASDRALSRARLRRLPARTDRHQSRERLGVRARSANFRYDVNISVNGRVRYARAVTGAPAPCALAPVVLVGEEPRVQVAHDPRYLIATGAVPSYDPALINNIHRSTCSSTETSGDTRTKRTSTTARASPTTRSGPWVWGWRPRRCRTPVPMTTSVRCRAGPRCIS